MRSHVMLQQDRTSWQNKRSDISCSQPIEAERLSDFIEIQRPRLFASLP